jgi:fatty-acyl-CoA synthase
MFHLDLRVVDDRDQSLPPMEMGEVVLRGPNVFKEYWRLPKETAEAKRGGWFHTGDMGYLDEEGYLWLVDRKKDMYISGGENVYPAEVEDVIYKMPQVKEVGVIGMPDPKWGEAGVAVVVTKPGMSLTGQEVLAFCQGKLAKYKIPKKVVFGEALPRTATGKVLKKELRARYL